MTSINILNVDDNPSGLYAKSRILHHAGFAVREATTGNAALSMLASEPVPLVLLDINLPDIDGYFVCRQIKANSEIRSTIVLQISSSFVEDAHRAQALENGADAYIAEPVDPMVLVATVRSLLRLHEAGEAERIARREWQATFDAINDGVAVLDSDGRVVRSNAALARLLAKTPVELSGSNCTQLIDGAEELLHGVWRTGHRQEKDIRVGERCFHMAVDPVSGEIGGPNGAVCLISDVSERKRMEEKVRQAQKMESLGTLAGGVAHDFNNLLTGILAGASLAMELFDANHPAYRLLQTVSGASERAAGLIRQLLAYSGQGQFAIEPVQLSAMVREMASALQSSLPNRVQLQLELDPDLPHLDADVRQIQQVIANLVVNAGEAIDQQGGAVTVRTGAEGHLVFLEVRDTGCGMDERTRDRIFDPFFTTKFPGRGLGLAAVQGIARSHGGAVEVETAPGAGSTFRVWLPAGEARRKPPERVEANKQTGMILIVDDEDMVRSIARASLERAGYRVLTAVDGAEGLERFRQNLHDIHVVLLDLTMPGMGGGETLERLRLLDSDVRVILSSGYLEADALRRLSAAPPAAFIQKPYTSARLLEKVEALLRPSVRKNARSS
ncbi:MAG: response regulator [Bryobacteraceae bacterium]